MADCTCVIVKALKQGDHHAFLPQARLKDHAKAAKLGLWPEAAFLPISLELQLVIATTPYHWLQAFHNLRWRGKRD